MDATIDSSIVFTKTPKGVAEINTRSGALTLQARRVLIMIDGRRPVAELMAVVRTGEFEGIISALETHSMIEKVDLAALPTRDYEEEDFADTISLLQENATALRAMPQIHPAALVPQPTAARPATITAEQNVVAPNDAALIAARAVAAASAPRPADPPVRRPPTISMPAPAANSDVVGGSARPATMNGNLKIVEPVRRPPTLSGVRPVAPVQERPAAAVEAPVRPATISQRAEPAPAAAAAATAPAPQAAPAAPAASTRTFEEERRLAVSELYSVLGPYGEQPAAKLQECTTIEALREQIKAAGKRVATFRGDKAAQDYLKTLGMA